VVDGQLLDAHFSRPIYKHMLGVSVSYHDLEAVEPEYYQSLCLLLSSPLSTLGVEDSLTFSADTQVYGENVVVDLTEGGQDLVVTDANKGEYVRLIAHHRMTAACKPQLEAFLTGFHSLVPLQVYVYIYIYKYIYLYIYICIFMYII
jgi:E3 ubiquitin-protein ligase HUWE1